jgi:oligopeptide transport system ATP-binding protein
MTALLQIEDLCVRYKARGKGVVHAVEGVSLCVAQGETLGIVGESGCGKSTLVRAVMGLVAPASGRIVLAGKDLGKLSASQLREARLDYQMVFQDPFASLDPAMPVGDIVAEALVRRKKLPRKEREAAVTAILERVGLPADSAARLPHEFSGGQRQRIAIARALATEPRLLIADEAVSALDVSVQSQILNLLMELRRERGLTMLFVSHDLAVVRHLCDRVAVMYLGKIVELGPTAEVMESPLHLYTKALLSASPVPDPVEQKRRLRILLRGEPPSPSNPPQGCAFAWRSPKSVPPEVAALPGALREVAPGRWVEIHPATVDDPAELTAQADALGAK